VTAVSESVFDLNAWIALRRDEVEALLNAQLPMPTDGDPGRLVESIRYSLLAPGKRLRPVFGLGGALAVGAELTPSIRLATAAVELIHCYSLIHDDLPAMDDDDMRRGRPSNHKAFGEATAILAGDGLLTLAFEWIARAGADATEPARYLEASRVLSKAAGITGMVRGQARDMADLTPASLAALETLHAEKTAALFQAAVEIGAIVGCASESHRADLAQFGYLYGIAFQHADDKDDQEHAQFADLSHSRLVTLLHDAQAKVAPLGPRALPLVAIARALGATVGVTLPG
jgi:geranylgeranyl diphosphate synthase, type II